MHIRGVMLRVWGMRVGRGCMRDRMQLMSYVPGASMSQGTFGYRKRRFFFLFFFCFFLFCFFLFFFLGV